MFSQPPIFLLTANEKFDGSNWIEWKGMILSTVKAHGLDRYLNRTITKPPDTSPGQTAPMATTYWGSKTLTLDDWQQCNAYTKEMIILNVKNPIGHGVQINGTTAKAWKSLIDIQDAVSDIGGINADMKL